jgi:electron transport complex protein RnfE
LVLLGGIRELLGSGKLFDITIYSENYVTLLFVLAPGAFIVLGYLIAIINRIKTD